MASYHGHLAFASVLGAAYGGAGICCWNLDWGPAFLAAGLTTVGGLLPDLDSDSGVPVREMFNLAATLTPFLVYRRLLSAGLTPEQLLVVLGGVYVLIRFGASEVFRRFTVHRGMFHSVPGMLITGLTVFLLYHSPDRMLRVYLAGGTMLGFLSHLILDEIYSVDFMGLRPKLNKYAGSALKFTSPSWLATGVTYLVMVCLGFLALIDWGS